MPYVLIRRSRGRIVESDISGALTSRTARSERRLGSVTDTRTSRGPCRSTTCSQRMRHAELMDDGCQWSKDRNAGKPCGNGVAEDIRDVWGDERI